MKSVLFASCVVLGMWSCIAFGSADDCAYIATPTFSSGSLSVEEFTNETLTFRVVNTCGSNSEKEKIDIQWKEPNNKDWRSFCILRQDKLRDNKCKCESFDTNFSCSFFNVFTRFWQWRITRFQNHTDLPINVTYPTNITHFSHTFEGNNIITFEKANVEVACKWDNGNPKRHILLRNDQNRKIIYSEDPGENTTGYFRKSITGTGSTSCTDSGRYACVAEGTNEQKTISLWIKCPPQFLHSDVEQGTSKLSQGSDAGFQFSILSYKNITGCMLKGPQDEQPKECTNNRSNITVSGALPRLNLAVVVSNVSEEDSGTWQLSVENGFQGNASIPNVATVNFTLDVMLQTSRDPSTGTTEPPPTSRLVSALIGVVGFLVLVIVVLVVFVVYYRKISQRKGAVIRTRNEDNQGDGFPDRVSGHSYEEVPDAAAPRSPRCHQPGQAAEPGGPYNSLEMSDVGLRSPYSQLGM